MSPEIVMSILGGVLVLTAILGGGFEVKEIKIPLIGAGSRVMAAAAGTVFLLWGAGKADGGPERPFEPEPGGYAAGGHRHGHEDHHHHHHGHEEHHHHHHHHDE